MTHLPVAAIDIGLPVLGGLLMTAAFPNVAISAAAWVALLPLLIITARQTVFNNFRLGILAGTVHYVTLMYWLACTMHSYGNLPWAVSIPVMLLLAFYLSLFIGLFCAVLAGLKRMPVTGALLIPLLWVCLEYLRSFLLSGFPWALMGYSQEGHLTLIQISDITGVYGVSFLIAGVNGGLYLLWRQFFHRGNSETMPTAPAFAYLAVMAALVGSALYYGYHRIGQMGQSADTAPRMSVVAVQGNIDQAIKWDRSYQETTTQKYLDLSLSAASGRPDLVIWPETAAPFYFSFEQDPAARSLTRQVIDGIRKSGSDFLIGSPSFTFNNSQVEYYNSAFLVLRNGRIADKYNKVHLVPFGEYVPLRKWIPFIGKIVQHVGDFQGGKKGKILVRGKDRLGVLICFEIIFPELSRAVTKNGAELLVNMTNDAWYGRTGAPFQHFGMAVFRAVENRRSLVRSANTGISGYIDPTGAAHGKTPLYEDAVASFSVPLLAEMSLYTKYGDIFAWGCILITIVLLIRGIFVSFRSTRS